MASAWGGCLDKLAVDHRRAASARHSCPRRLTIVIAAVLAFACSAHALAECKVEKYAELPVMMHDRQPIIEGTINGARATFVADSGAFFSMLWSDRIERFKLLFRNKAESIPMYGSSGSVSAHRTTVDDFTLRGFGSGVVHKVQFLVVGDSVDGTDGVIGQNIIGRADTEFDLANGVIRLFHTTGCENYSLAYWHGTAPVSEMRIQPLSDLHQHILGTATLNGREIRVLLDTGASSSALTLRAAKQAGFDPAKAERSFPAVTSPMGGRATELWFERFEVLDLGGEKIRNVLLQVNDFPDVDEFDMLLGVDFFLSHRIYVSGSQHKLYFTYNGGPVFDLREPHAIGTSGSAGAPVAAAAPAAVSEPSSDAEEYARRGAAADTRGDRATAMADFDAAIRLNPSDAESFYRRGTVRWENHDNAGARADFDQALKLRPDVPEWLTARGMLLLDLGDDAGAAADFDASVRVTPTKENPDLTVADIYESHGRYEQAVSRVSRWIDTHGNDPKLPQAQNSRCWFRAQWGKELDQALADCNAALKGRPTDGAALDSRGLVWLRLGKYDNSIADYKAALRVQPKQPTSLYGLAVAQIRSGNTVDGNKKMLEALATDSTVAERFKKFGVTP